MSHLPVLLNEVVESLQLKPNLNVVDCTLGDGGHAAAILERTSPNGRLVGIDADHESLARAAKNLAKFKERTVLINDNFTNLKKIAAKSLLKPIHGILFDLGWSSSQFLESGRGFSFLTSEPLDMRYGGKGDATARDIVNGYSLQNLAAIFKQLGQEKFSDNIARAIVERREKKAIESTDQLTEIILSVYRQKLKSKNQVPWVGGLHPATKIFMALRVEVNHELEAIKQALPLAVDCLSAQGRLAVITFHSLEDRLVKQYFKSIAGKKIKLVSKKPIIPLRTEITNNNRARSAKLRVVEKL